MVLPRAQQLTEDPETSLFHQLAQQVSVCLLETDRIDLKRWTKTESHALSSSRLISSQMAYTSLSSHWLAEVFNNESSKTSLMFL